MKPNHHWVLHLPDQLRDYASVYNFWTFLTERLNKLLKSSNSNYQMGGQLEVSMMREFDRSVRLQDLVRQQFLVQGSESTKGFVPIDERCL